VNGSGPPPSALRAATSPSRGGLIQPAEKLGEIALARLRRRGLESSAEGGGDARVSGRNVDSDDSPIHTEFRRRNLFTF
jgi:hypothetical protein